RRTQRFDRRMAAVSALESIMEEALDQDEEILWPPPPSPGFTSRDHESFARANGVAHIATLPLRVDEHAVAALTCERNERPFTQSEVQQLRLACDTVSRRLADLHRTDRWFGARWLDAVRRKAARLGGPQHTWTKVGAIFGTLALIALVLPVYPYRVEASFVLRSDEVAFVSAPFEGYIQSVAVRPGDSLPAGGPLLSLNTDQLVLEESAALAD